MIVIRSKFLGIFLFGLALSTSSFAAEPVTPKLTDKLSSLLQQEMRSIQGAMAAIHSAMVMGNNELVAEQAQQIHDSFILKQSLTEQDRKDLKAAVPKGFIKLDKEFHQLAQALAKAGRENNPKEQHKLFSKMTEQCLQCHSEYVSDRFSGLQSYEN